MKGQKERKKEKETRVKSKLTLTLREDIRVEVVHGIRASRGKKAKLSAVNRGQRVDGERERDLSEGHLHVIEGQRVSVLSVQLQNLISCVQTCDRFNKYGNNP